MYRLRKVRMKTARRVFESMNVKRSVQMEKNNLDISYVYISSISLFEVKRITAPMNIFLIK